jgi:hypothetical protein
MMKLTSIALTLVSTALAAQQAPPVRLINAPDGSTKQVLGTVAAVRQLPDGGLLVNDIQNRQLLLLDHSLANVVVVADSTSGGASSYGIRPGGIIAYLGDSTLFVDPAGLSMFVIDPTGKIARVASVPRSQDAPTLGSNLQGLPSLDARGRIVYRGGLGRILPQGGARGGGGPIALPDFPDSAALVRVDLATRKLDTAAFFKIPKIKMSVTQTERGMSMMSEVNPLPLVDDWAVLSDGSIAILRGQDYHLDFVNPDGSLTVSPKIPFDWQRLSDEDKTAIIDSARTKAEKARAAAISGGAPGADGGRGGGTIVMNFNTGDGARTSSAGGGPVSLPPLAFVSINEMPDYRPAFSQGAARADIDGNLWVRTSAVRTGSVGGGPIYDVINRKGEVIDRLQVPAGRQIVGFGKGGVVYMQARDDKAAWIERTHR